MCKGLTHKGLPCRNRQYAEYCGLHMDQTPIALYTPPARWPSSQAVKCRLARIPMLLTVGMLKGHLNKLFLLVGNSEMFNRLFVITCVELLKRNAEVCLTDLELQRFVSEGVTKLEEVPELARYTEDFKRRCLASHRAAARKRVVSFYFTRCEDLCDDVIERVMTFV
jgi:hypothetical protein